MVTYRDRNAAKNRRESGTSVLEMAIVLPLLLITLFAIGDFGIAYTRWNSLTNAAREGARVGVVFRSPCVAGTVTSQVQTTVENFATLSGLDPATITTTVTGACTGTGTPLTVNTVSPYTFLAIADLAGFGPSTDLKAQTVMRNE